jgi:hypothetical protein
MASWQFNMLSAFLAVIFVALFQIVVRLDRILKEVGRLRQAVEEANDRD